MKALHQWFLNNRRDFPWRVLPTPYRVWISEVMLQQTRASVVVPYFEKWMALFPNVEKLAEAPIEKVIKAWEGLGYYSRARNLHKGAQHIVKEFGGEIPAERAALESIPGLGPYTVGAILSFGFQKRAAAVDGNVARVLSRYLLIEENICKQKVRKKLFEQAEALLDPIEPWVTSEALIELGATICTPKPRCEACPIQSCCLALHHHKVDALPIKNEEKPVTELWRLVVWIEADDKVLVRKERAGRVMADLYEFPYFELKQNYCSEKEAINQVKKLGLKVVMKQRLPVVCHTFTRYKAHLYPFRMATQEESVDGYEWLPIEKLRDVPFSSGHRRILSL